MPDNKKKKMAQKKNTTSKNKSNSAVKSVKKSQKSVKSSAPTNKLDESKQKVVKSSVKATSTANNSKNKVSTSKKVQANSKQQIKQTSAKIKKVDNTKNKSIKNKEVKINAIENQLVETKNVKKTKINTENKSSNNNKVNTKQKKSSKSLNKNSLVNNKSNNKSKKVAKKDKNKVKKKITIPTFSKKTKICLLVVAIICIVIIVAEIGYLVYRQNYIDRNTIYYDSLNSLAIDDMDIVAVGSSNFRYSKNYSYTKGLEKAKIIKYDKNGKIVFEKMYKTGINTTFSSIINVSDGYIVVGSGVFSKEEQQNEAREAIIIKYDKEGNIVWEKFYQVVTNTRFNKVIATNDGYIVVGQSIYANMEMGNHTTGGGIIVKYDFDGNEVWHNNHGGMKSGNFNDVVEVNGEFYVVGKDATDSANIVKYDGNGQYKWHKNYSYTDGIGFTGIAYLDNSLYVVGSKKILPEGTGDSDQRNTTNTDALLVKYDLDGKVILEKCFGGSNYERYNSILAYRNDLYVIGHTTSKDAGIKVSTDGELMTGILLRYDKNGNILKKVSFGGSNNDNLTDIITDSASIYISAYSNSGDGNMTTARNNGKDYFGKVVKLDFKFRTLMVK